MSRYYRSILNVQQGVILDPDALLYLQAIRPHYSATWFDDIALTEEQWDRVASDLFVSQKDFQIYDKNKAFYPLAGGTAGAHKFNGKDPRDLNAAFRLNFVGSPTHSANGVQGNGSTTYAESFIFTNTNINTNNNSFFLYSNDNAQEPTGTNSEFGFRISENISGLFNSLRTSTNVHVVRNMGDATAFQVSNTNGIGFFGINRIVNTEFIQYTNGIFTTRASSSITFPNLMVYVFGRNIGGTSFNSSIRRQAFFSWGDGLTNSEITMYNNLVVSFQTALGRA
jgi:hypothetical protein